jgi:thiamine biosynthesis lipoprotein ApbE
MDASNRDALSAVVARQRGRGRLRSATVAVGAAGLVAAGAIAYTLPSGVTHTTATATAGTAAAGSSTTHAASGGSGVATTTSRHLGRLLMTAGTTGPATREASASWQALGTGVQVTVTDAGQLAPARGMLEADLAAVDLACSRFRPDSEIVTLDRIMGGAAAGPVTVSPLLAEAIAVALRAARLTDGDVDPTVGAAMNAVGYDRDFSLVQRDGPAVRLTVRTVPGWRQVELDEQALLLRVPPGVRLDLGATAKAWAADRSAARIAALLGCGVLVSLGGDIAVSGQPPAGGWRIRVQDISGRPEDPPAGPSAVVAIHGGGLATSSTAARRWRRGGDVLHHILDPRTGLPAAPVWRTVSVAAASCTDANIASTAAIIKGRAAPGWLTGLGLPARLVDEAGRVRTIGGWPAETAGGTP